MSEPEELDGSFDDIELAYREAMKSLDDAEQQIGSAMLDLADEGSEDDAEESAFTSIGDELADDLEAHADHAIPEEIGDEGDVRASPRSVVEAALFVGGEVSLTAKRLASLIGQETEPRLAVSLIDQLNDDYATQNRPYEIRLREGGFRLELKGVHADIQANVFGLGPREVRLSPEVLEVLAFIAYNQPVTKEDLKTVRGSQPQAHAKRLVRLQLVEVRQTGTRRSDVSYETGQRFLDLFGLRDLSELPQADLFSFK